MQKGMNKWGVEKGNVKETNNVRYKQARELAIFSLGGKCERCGEDNVKALEVHHPNKDRKEHLKFCYKTKKKVKTRVSLIKYWEGIAIKATPFKVMLLCATCHKLEEELCVWTGVG